MDIQNIGIEIKKDLKYLIENSMQLFLIVAALIFTWIIYAAVSIPHFLRLPIIAFWFYCSIKVWLCYGEDCQGEKGIDMTLVTHILIACAVIGAFAGAVIDIAG